MDNNMNTEIEKMLLEGFDQIAPDIFDEIKNADFKRIETEEELFGELPKKKSSKHWIPASAVAAAAVLFICIFSISSISNNVDAGEIYIDVNPGVVLHLNNVDEVSGIESANEDAVQIVDNVLDNTTLPSSVDTAIESVVDEIQAEGYLSDEESSNILISYSYKEKPSKTVASEIKTAMKDYKYEFAAFAKDKEQQKAAGKYQMTPGKYHYLLTHDMDPAEYSKTPMVDIVKTVKSQETKAKSKGKKAKKDKKQKTQKANTNSTKETPTKEHTNASESKGSSGSNNSGGSNGSSSEKAKSSNSSGSNSHSNSSGNSNKNSKSNNKPDKSSDE